MLTTINIFESTSSTLFLLIEIFILIASLGVVLLPRIIYSALCLGFVFINIALMYLLLQAEFLAAAQVLIYVGAINVLILFAIMLVNFPYNETYKVVNLGGSISAVVFSILFASLLIVIIQTPWESFANLNYTNSISQTNVELIGISLLNDFLLPFELLSLLLLVALVGAITIARKQAPLN
jgi:NAD(P)H-quinone oxidoreductase subunit 6